MSIGLSTREQSILNNQLCLLQEKSQFLGAFWAFSLDPNTYWYFVAKTCMPKLPFFLYFICLTTREDLNSLTRDWFMPLTTRECPFSFLYRVVTPWMTSICTSSLANDLLLFHITKVILGASLSGKVSACTVGDSDLIPGSGRSSEQEMGYPLQYSWASLVAHLVKYLPAMWETWVWSLGWEDVLENGKATHSSILTGEFHGL